MCVAYPCSLLVRRDRLKINFMLIQRIRKYNKDGRYGL